MGLLSNSAPCSIYLQPLKTPQNPDALTPEKSRRYHTPISLNRSEKVK
jgi:hypothetical protein